MSFGDEPLATEAAAPNANSVRRDEAPSVADGVSDETLFLASGLGARFDAGWVRLGPLAGEGCSTLVLEEGSTAARVSTASVPLRASPPADGEAPVPASAASGSKVMAITSATASRPSAQLLAVRRRAERRPPRVTPSSKAIAPS